MHPVHLPDHRGKFFHVLAQTDRSQIATMTIAPGKDSGEGDKHPGDQVVYVIEGVANVEIKDTTHELKAGDCIIIPQGSPHRISNPGGKDLFFLNVYAPPAY